MIAPHVAAAVYSALLSAIAFGGIWIYAVRGGRLIAAPMGPAAERASIGRFSIGTLAYAGTVALPFASARQRWPCSSPSPCTTASSR